MTPTEIRIAMAELEGLKRTAGCPCEEESCGAWYNPKDGTWSYLDDYLNDLNAVHRVFLTFNRVQRINYADNLMKVVSYFPVGCVPDYHSDLNALAHVAHATALQRCEAILRTVGKWKESAV